MSECQMQMLFPVFMINVKTILQQMLCKILLNFLSGFRHQNLIELAFFSPKTEFLRKYIKIHLLN